jgi:serine/threonine protein kinase
MMKLVNHPNIMRIYDAFEGLTELYLVLEYVEDGKLFDSSLTEAFSRQMKPSPTSNKSYTASTTHISSPSSTTTPNQRTS